MWQRLPSYPSIHVQLKSPPPGAAQLFSPALLQCSHASTQIQTTIVQQMIISVIVLQSVIRLSVFLTTNNTHTPLHVQY